MYQNQEGVDFENLYPWNEFSILCPQRAIILENAFAVCCSTVHPFLSSFNVSTLPWEKVYTESWLKQNKTKHNKTKANQIGNAPFAFSPIFWEFVSSLPYWVSSLGFLVGKALEGSIA